MADFKGTIVKIWGLKTCDTCRKARKVLSQKYDGIENIDVRVNGVLPDDSKRFYEAFGDALVNQRSTTWRGLEPEERLLDPLELLAAHPTLMKRPVIEANGQLYLGWGKDVQAALLD